MARFSYRDSSSPTNITQLEVYKKAVEIFKLSRHIATYISDNKNILEMGRSTNNLDRYSFNLITDSMSLVPTIATVTLSFDRSIQRYNMYSLRKTVNRMKNYCNYLEKNYTQAKEYIALLRTEIAAFSYERNLWENNLK